MKHTYKLFLLSLLFIFTSFAQDSTVTNVGPGVKYHKVKKTTPDGPWQITILEMNVANADIKIKAEVARDNLGTGLERTTSMATRNNKPDHIVLGAINGDYFGISEPLNPYGFLSNSMIKEKEVVFGRSHVRSSFGFRGDNNKPVIGILNIGGVVEAKNGLTNNINLVNSTRGTNQMVLFNPFFVDSTRTNENGTEIRLTPIDDPIINSFRRFVVNEKVSGIGNMEILENYVLSGHGTSNTFLTNNINIGDTIKIKLDGTPQAGNLLSLMGGGPRLITDGVRPPSFVGYEGFGESHVNTRHPRTAIGFNADSSKVYFLVVDGRQPAISIGMSCAELADYMISIGCAQAVNLDGGGSSTMLVRGSIMNSPSDGSERSVGNALLAVLEAPSIGYMQSFKLLPRQILIDTTQTRKINISAKDQWNYPIEVAHSNFTWQIVGLGGSINSNGFFVPSGTGSGKIIARYGTMADTIDVSVISELIPVWSLSAAGGNLPSWFSPTGSTERGMTVGVVDGEPRLLVVSRSSGTQLKVLNASNGDQLSNYNTSGTSGGTYILSDAEASDDGRIFAANLTIDALTNPFKVYMWENETVSPQVVLNFTSDIATVRLGDKFTVVGSYTAGTAQIYAAQASSNRIFKWSMANGVFNPVPKIITLQGTTNIGFTPAVYPKGLDSTDNIYVNATTIRPREYTQAGVLVAEAPSSAVASTSSAMKYFKSAQQQYLIVFQHGLNNENAKVLEVSGGLATPIVVETSPTLGTNANTVGTSGDVAYRKYQPGVYIYYVMSTNNGLGAYQIVNENEIPVELTSFTGYVTNGSVYLNWMTATETNNQGFEIQRSIGNNPFTTIGYVSGNGTSTEVNHYNYTDNTSGLGGTILYRLKQIDLDGTFTYSNTIELDFAPISYSLSQNYPNPFNPSTVINYSVAEKGVTTIKLYNILGSEVATLVNEVKEPGMHKIDFDGTGLSSGVYIYKMTSGKYSASKKLMMLK
jgi:hypothetical protein